jgi:glutamate racemase
MTKEIEEAARDLIAFWYDDKARVGMDKHVKALEKALNPKPTREEVIRDLQEALEEVEEGTSIFAQTHEKYIRQGIELLQDKPNTWIKNTGVAPKSTQVVARLKSGMIAEQMVNRLDWKLDASLPITEYMIIE